MTKRIFPMVVVMAGLASTAALAQATKPPAAPATPAAKPAAPAAAPAPAAVKPDTAAKPETAAKPDAAPAPAAAPAPGGPAATTATTAAPPPTSGGISAEALAAGVGYGDWILRCQQLPPGTDPARQCEVVQTLMLQGQTQPIAQMAVGKIKKADPLKITIALPPNVFLATGARISTDSKDPSPVELTWRRCLPGACIADKELSDNQLRRWKAINGLGVMAWTDGANQPLTISMSFRGLGRALDALAKEQ